MEQRCVLRVKRQVSRINGEVVKAPLKTKNAYRTLPMAEDTIDVLKEQREKVGNSPWVFPSPNGGPPGTETGGAAQRQGAQTMAGLLGCG